MAIISLYLAMQDNQKDKTSIEEFYEFQQEIKKDDIIVHTSLNTEIPVAYYVKDCQQYLLETENTPIDRLVFPNIESPISYNELVSQIQKGKTVWLFVYPTDYEFINELQNYAIDCRKQSNQKIDWCEFSVYKIKSIKAVK